VQVDEHSLLIAIVAGETSGDRLGAGLIGAIKSRFPDTRFVGVGGPKMAAAGCKLLFDMDRIGVMGLDGLFDKLFDILKIRRSLFRQFAGTCPDVFVGIDVPDFNLSLERKLKHRKITCVHYVSPTVWAWRGYRIHKIRRSIDHMLTLFPFEADYYQKHGVPVTCVGHPMADEFSEPDRDSARQQLNLDQGLIIALLPGSRRSEIRRMGGIFIDAVKCILQQHPDAKFLLPFASHSVAEEFHGITGDISSLPVFTLDGNSRLALEACNLAILASGTAALEAALLRRPHIVVYKLTAFSHWLMRRLRHVDYYSMPNHLLPTPMIPELIQHQATAENISQEVDSLLQDPDKVARLERYFADLHQDLKLGASTRAGEVVLRLAGAGV